MSERAEREKGLEVKVSLGRIRMKGVWKA